jgi:ABC-type polysaccharide/polyol phosphate export permease
LYLTWFDGGVLEGMEAESTIVYVPLAFLLAFLDLIVNKWLLLMLYYVLSFVALFVGYYIYSKRRQRVRTLPQKT